MAVFNGVAIVSEVRKKNEQYIGTMYVITTMALDVSAALNVLTYEPSEAATEELPIPTLIFS